VKDHQTRATSGDEASASKKAIEPIGSSIVDEGASFDSTPVSMIEWVGQKRRGHDGLHPYKLGDACHMPVTGIAHRTTVAAAPPVNRRSTAERETPFGLWRNTRGMTRPVAHEHGVMNEDDATLHGVG
jgi:hypothetical protein